MVTIVEHTTIACDFSIILYNTLSIIFTKIYAVWRAFVYLKRRHNIWIISTTKIQNEITNYGTYLFDKTVLHIFYYKHTVVYHTHQWNKILRSYIHSFPPVGTCLVLLLFIFTAIYWIIKYIDIVYVHLITYHLHNKYHHVSGDNRIVHYPDHQYGMFLHFYMLARPELDIYLKFRKHRLLSTYCSIILFTY